MIVPGAMVLSAAAASAARTIVMRVRSVIKSAIPLRATLWKKALCARVRLIIVTGR